MRAHSTGWLSAPELKLLVRVLKEAPAGTLPTPTEPLVEKGAETLVAVTHFMAPVARELRLWMLLICTVTLMPVKPAVLVQYWMKFCP